MKRVDRIDLIDQYIVVEGGLTPSTKQRVVIGIWLDHTNDPDPIHQVEDAPDRVLYLDL